MKLVLRIDLDEREVTAFRAYYGLAPREGVREHIRSTMERSLRALIEDVCSECDDPSINTPSSR